ncbi:hypothetical protein [uncultured Gammaproteobacteria bacterium]|nr:hypothetical protein [uncultured Gammaproteobacteria bacterium]CAC9625432.1 hypothetical protein [uncultured Gammaproteobacteria bacterium]
MKLPFFHLKICQTTSYPPCFWTSKGLSSVFPKLRWIALFHTQRTPCLAF